MKMASVIILSFFLLLLSVGCVPNKPLIEVQKNYYSGNCTLAKQLVDNALKSNPKDEKLLAWKNKVEICLKKQDFAMCVTRISLMNRYDLISRLKEYKEALALNINNNWATAGVEACEVEISTVNDHILSIQNRIIKKQIWEAFEGYEQISPYSDYLPEVKAIYSSLEGCIPTAIEDFRREYRTILLEHFKPHHQLLLKLFPKNPTVSSLKEEFEAYFEGKYNKIIEGATKGLNKDWLGLAYLMYEEATKEYVFPNLASKLAEIKQRIAESKPPITVDFSENISKETRALLLNLLSSKYSPCYAKNSARIIGKDDLLLSIMCANESLEEAGRDSRGLVYSEFQNGTEQKANPAYDIVYQGYAQTKHNYDQMYVYYLSNPSLVSSVFLIEAQNALKKAEAILLRTPRFVEVPRYESYQYEKYNISTTTNVTYEYQLIDLVMKEEIGRKVIKKENRGRGSTIQQAHPNDRYGIMNIDYPVQKSLDLFESTKKEAYSEMVESVLDDVIVGQKQKAKVLLSMGKIALGTDALGRYAALNPSKDDLVEDSEIRKNIDSVLNGGIGFFLDKAVTIVGKNNPISILQNAPKQSLIQQTQQVRSRKIEDVEALISGSARAVVSIKTILGEGSGFLISSDGQILTNNHVIEGCKDIIVVKQNGNKYFASVIKNDKNSDLALIKIEATNNQYLELTDSKTANVGSSVIIIGSPFGLEQTVTKGIVSAKRSYMGQTLVQTDAAINPGNSGGPLITMDGYVIGIVSQAIKKSIGEGLGFAISSEDIRAFLIK